MDSLHTPNFIVRNPKGLGKCYFKNLFSHRNLVGVLHTHQTAHYVDFMCSCVSTLGIIGYERVSEARQPEEKVRDERKAGCGKQQFKEQIETLRGSTAVILMVSLSLKLDHMDEDKGMF